MKHGYYLIKHEGFLVPARFDGEKFHHEHGSSHDNECVKDEQDNPITFDFVCPTGCTCTSNSDGSTSVKCS